MEAFLNAVPYLGTLLYWQALVAGVLLAILVGLVPGVGSVLVMAILLPFIILNIDDPAVALVMLAAIAGSNNTLDSIPAVVVGVPAGATQVTFLEGHQLARRGQAAHTLGAIYAVSALGGVIGAVALAMIIPVIKPFILMIDRSEIAVIAMFGIAMVALYIFVFYEERLYAEASLPEELGEEAGRFGIHPALLESALHVLGLAKAGPEVELPCSWHGAVLHRAGARTLHLSLSPQAEAHAAAAFDEDGEAVFSVGSVARRPRPLEDLRAAQRRRFLHRVAWRPVRPPSAGATEPAPVRGAWEIGKKTRPRPPPKPSPPATPGA